MLANLAEGDACCRLCRQLMPNFAKFEEKFRKSVVVDENGCHIWQGVTNPSTGYGTMAVGSTKKMGAHRFAWSLKFGEIPKGLEVCHRCDVRTCCNVDHLFLGTRKENLADMRRKGRHAHGDRHWTKTADRAARSAARGTITAETAKAIRVTYAKGKLSQTELAEKFGVGRSLVCAVLAGKTWKYAGGPKVDGKDMLLQRTLDRRQRKKDGKA